MGKVIDSYVESIFLKDSCDGSGLNTSENSKGSHPLGLKGFFLVILFNFHEVEELIKRRPRASNGQHSAVPSALLYTFWDH